MLSKIKNYIKKCALCQKTKHGKTTKLQMKITYTSSYPFEKIFLDIVVLPETHANNRCILTCQDDLTKYSLAIAIPNQEAETMAEVFCENFICRFGTPESILTDQDNNFMGDVFKSL